MKVGNYIRTASVVGRGWAIDLHLVADDEEAYQRAKDTIKDLVSDKPEYKEWWTTPDA